MSKKLLGLLMLVTCAHTTYAHELPVRIDTNLKNALNIKEAKTIYRALSHPVFFVGNDSVSKKWLEKNREVLNNLGATGFVIKADSVKEVSDLRKRAGMVLHIADGDEAGQLYDFDSFPTLILPQENKG